MGAGGRHAFDQLFRHAFDASMLTRSQKPQEPFTFDRVIEALRTSSVEDAVPGLMLGMEDARLAAAIRRIYQYPGRAWTMERLAGEAGMSRTAFFERFRKVVGATPMEHLTAWRMAIAKNLLLQDCRVSEVAGRVGYASISSFSTAFRRYAGASPGQFVDAHLRQVAANDR